MNHFHYDQDALYCDGAALADIAARAGTPCYIYSSAAVLERFRAYDQALARVPHKICYAVKANSNLAILRLLATAGASFDIVSGGELFRVLKSGGAASSVVFSGVGKTAGEIEQALDAGIHSFNCESEAEISLIHALASRRGVAAPVAIRVNPDVDAATHPYISTGMRDHKFGIDMASVEGVYERALSLSGVRLEGVSCHIGSQLLDTGPLMEALDRMLALVDRLRAKRIPIRSLDLGGGLGVRYKREDDAPDIADYASELGAKMRGRDLQIMVEPGRSIVAQAGVLVTRVLYRKQSERKDFVIVDAAMNDLIRPALYHAHHEIIPLRQRDMGAITADVVGPICESGDFFARNRKMANVLPGDYLAICTGGAYGFVAASNYNSRRRPPEILVEGETWRVVRKRETWEDLIRGEEV